MAAKAHTALLMPILQELHTRIADLEEIVILRRDRTLLASINQKDSDLSAATILTELANLTDEMCDTLEHGVATEAMVKGKNRFLAIYALHEADVLLGISGQSTVNFGLLNSGCRTAIEKIHKILQEV